ncbi:MAG: hypothetical protein RLZZ241_375 [Bacteroidota bacterium]
MMPLFLVSAKPFWSATGHRVVGQVADKNLNVRARKEVNRLLKGQSLAEAATFGDDIKSEPAFRKFSPWHYVNLTPDGTYEEVKDNKEGDIVQGIAYCIQVLKDNAASEADQAFYLKLLIHFIGDLHQPLHVGRAEDRGGNQIQLQWFDRGTNLHRLWDSNLIDDYGMSYMELAENLPKWSKAKINDVQGGEVLDWVYEVRTVVNRIYDGVNTGDKLSYRYSYDWWPTVEDQLLRGGLRLAAVLNAIYQ